MYRNLMLIKALGIQKKQVCELAGVTPGAATVWTPRLEHYAGVILESPVYKLKAAELLSLLGEYLSAPIRNPDIAPD